MLSWVEHAEMCAALATMGTILFLAIMRALDGKPETPIDAANRRHRG